MKQEVNGEYPQRAKKQDLSPMLYGKMPPQAPELEGAILGAMMLEPQKVEDVIAIIETPEAFYSDANQRIYAAIRRMFDKGSRIDFMTVCEELRSQSELEMVGGSYYVTGLTRDVVSSAHIEEHAHIVVRKYVSREIIRISGEIISEAYEDETDSIELVEKGERLFTKLSEENTKADYKHVSYNAMEDITELEAHMKRREEFGNVLTGIQTGFPTLNRITNGWQKGELIILAARPAVGKTAFALNLSLNAGCPVGFFSMEMNLQSLRKRINSINTCVPLTNINAADLSKEQFEKIKGNLSRLKGTELYFDDSDTITVFNIKSKARRMVKKQGVELIIIDYLQLITATNEKMIREQQVSQISRQLKNLSKELQIPIIALSQLSRGIDTRKENKEPMLSDLRESGAIEQDADLVSFLYWHDGKVRLKIAKHRNGKIDRVDFTPNLDIQTFKEVGQDFPEVNIVGYKPTEYSGNLIPLAEANKKFEDEEEELPF